MASPGSEFPHWFNNTHWSIIWAAKAQDTVVAQKARERLCETYWQPVYHFLRRQGRQPADAQDLTQEFFAQFLARNWLDHLEDQRGKFRCFLLTFLKHFLSDQRDRANAQKRGGGKQIISIDAIEAEANVALLASTQLTPEEAYDRRWAETVLLKAASDIRKAYYARGKGELYEAIKDVVPGRHGERSYAQIGAALGMTEQAVKNAVLAFRRRYRELLREEIAHTVIDPEKLEEEIQDFMKMFGS
jgi:RNA polymerase sigma factor (sigma-70 family)